MSPIARLAASGRSLLLRIAARRSIAAAALLAAVLAAGCTARHARTDAGHGEEEPRATLAILESTDIHANVLSYDYYKLAEDPSIGFERLATLIRAARAEYENSLLFDGGDTIQGTALADWQALAAPLPCDRKLAVYKAMDALGYDGGVIGNHEFNYGLPYLAQVTGRRLQAEGADQRTCNGPDFPLVLANVIATRDGKPLFAPTALLERRVKARGRDGRVRELPIRIGIIGFTPPPIMVWDRSHLEGRVTTLGLVEASRRYAPALRAQGADLIVAISHGGIDPAPYSPPMENANWHLAQEPDIDVLLLGHSHQAFPAPGDARSRFNDMPGVDNRRGFIHGKPAVMGNFWGKSLGVIELGLVRRGGRWAIDADATHAEVRDIGRADGSFVAPDPAIRELVRDEHQGAIDYVSTPIGDSDFALTTYFAAVGDVSALQPVNTAQRLWIERHIAEELPQYAGIPVLSAAAPFKVGFGGANDYAAIEAGPLAIRNAADLYPYPNTLTAVRIDGAGLKAWLERSAGYFNRIDPQRQAPQTLINRGHAGYNFDVIQGGIRYVIDVTRPEGERIVDLRYRGRPVDPAEPFIVATNNYRASGGGDFPGLDGSSIVVEAAVANRDALVEWMRARRHLTREEDGADRSWRFAAVRTAGPVIFRSAAGRIGLARAAGLDFVHALEETGGGMADYRIDLGAAH